MDSVQLSPLVFLHPDGFIHHSMAIGDNVPARLIPPDQDQTGKQPADLILWAPSQEECQKPGGLESMAERIRGRLAPDGFIYAFIPTRWRWQAQHLLRNQGLEIGLALAHLPDFSQSHHWVPLETAPAEYMFTRQFPTHALTRMAGLAALRTAPGRVLVRFGFPSVAFVARPRDSRYLFQWLFQLAGIQPEVGRASLTVRWKGKRCSAVIHCYEQGPIPKAVAKTIAAGNDPIQPVDESHNLKRFGPAARLAGAMVPQPLKRVSLGGIPVFLQSFLAGTCAAAALAGHPEHVTATIQRISAWLLAWNQATTVAHIVDNPFINQTIRNPFNSIGPQLADGAEYLSWLIDGCMKLNASVQTVDAHNDLTLWNILLQPDGAIGVVDWQEARSAVLPLGDFFYLFVDTIAVAHRCGHDLAFFECLESRGRYYRLFRATLARMQTALDLSMPVVNLSLHACFLHHAANEQHERPPAENHPFLQILRWLEKNRQVLALEET